MESSKPTGKENHGDLLVHDFWKTGTICVFDVMITDTDTQSNRGTDPEKHLTQKEELKKAKHLNACHERHQDFFLLVFYLAE